MFVPHASLPAALDASTITGEDPLDAIGTCGSPRNGGRCRIERGYARAGNVDHYPLFVEADGADDIPGADNDDRHLRPVLPCVDENDDATVTVAFDSEGNPLLTSEEGNGDPTGHPGAYQSSEFAIIGELDVSRPSVRMPGTPSGRGSSCARR